ncbi:Ubiquitin carboxyl-terminal hydrolase 10-like 2, partial [Homarus americanus]
YFFSNYHSNVNNKDSLAGQFSQLTHKIWCGKYSSLRPADFKDAFGQQWRDFRDYRQETVGLDSGAASPKSSVSSSSVDAHLVNLRLQPIPEEVRALIPTQMNVSCDDLSLAGTTSCHDAESVTSDISDPAEVCGSSSIRRYNQLGGGAGDLCDSSDCDISTTHNLVPNSGLQTLHCDSSSSLEKNHLHESLRQEKNQRLLANRPEKTENCDVEFPHSHLVKLDDNIKESKTSNVNVSVKDDPANNELLFNSEKYGKFEKSRLKNSLDNLGKSGTKRVKEVNLFHDKRGCQPMVVEGEFDSEELDNRDELAINKRIRLEEKNVQYELEKYQVATVDRTVDSSTSTSESELHVAPSPSVSSHEHRQAELTWRSFVGDAKSAVVETFYGQFKSSMVCSACGHKSVKYDPFGTLSVPLPYANQIQISVAYVQSCGGVPTRYLITLCKVSYVSDLKAALCKMVGLNTAEHLVTAEVFDNHIARIVEDGYMTKFLNYNLRSIYAFQLAPPPPSVEEEAPEVLVESTSGEMSCKHHGRESLPCPVCQVSLTPADLIPVEKRRIEKPKARLLRVPLVFRMDQESDNNNKRCMQLMGHPGLLALPSRLSPASLIRTLAFRIPPDTNYSLLYVDGRGYNCSRCLFSSHCRGCEVLGGSEVILQAGDTLCVRFTSLTPAQCHILASTIDHPTLKDMRQNVPLTLYDCLRAFTQSETLEETDSWFCPKCERKQPATKTISVWRYPPYLIIHLERFLFHGTMSTKLDDKVIFPLDGLDVSDYVASENGSRKMYNLYAYVCHTGVAQAGHYTAFARSPVTGEWHYFNDDSVTRQKPREEEYSTAYLLFYHRQGTKFDLNLPQDFGCVDSGIPKHMGECEEEMACSSGTSTSNFTGPRPSLADSGVEVVEESSGQQPVFQINKIIDNLSETCKNDSSMEE